MENWAVEFAKELKARDNKTVIGPVLGTVIEPPPKLKISILEGRIFLTQIYILDWVLRDWSRRINLPFENVAGEITLTPYETTREVGKLLDSKDYKINLLEVKDKETVTADTLKKGDEVLLIASDDNQKFFCLGRVSRVGG